MFLTLSLYFSRLFSQSLYFFSSVGLCASFSFLSLDLCISHPIPISLSLSWQFTFTLSLPRDKPKEYERREEEHDRDEEGVEGGVDHVRPQRQEDHVGHGGEDAAQGLTGEHRAHVRGGELAGNAQEAALWRKK